MSDDFGYHFTGRLTPSSHRGMIEAKNMASVSATVMKSLTSLNKQRVKFNIKTIGSAVSGGESYSLTFLKVIPL